jgi:hypothetical protein
MLVIHYHRYFLFNQVHLIENYKLLFYYLGYFLSNHIFVYRRFPIISSIYSCFLLIKYFFVNYYLRINHVRYLNYFKFFLFFSNYFYMMKKFSLLWLHSAICIQKKDRRNLFFIKFQIRQSLNFYFFHEKKKKNLDHLNLLQMAQLMLRDHYLYL